jgi:hypothetical protein
MIKILHLKRANGDKAVVATQFEYQGDFHLKHQKQYFAEQLGWSEGEIDIEQMHDAPYALLERSYSKEKVRAEVVCEVLK